jgi:DNA-binding transcriptional regulator/RsmH inhibitor MraZ
VRDIEFDKNGKLILPKNFKKVLKREERFFDEYDLYEQDLINYEKD